jgi:hypothetical protein
MQPVPRPRSGSTQWPLPHPGPLARAGRWVWNSPANTSLDSLAQSFEIGSICWRSWSGGCSFKQQSAQMKPICIIPNQFMHVFTARAVASLGHLLVDERFQCIGKGDTHRIHGFMIDPLASFGKTRPSECPQAFPDVIRAFHSHRASFKLLPLAPPARSGTGSSSAHIVGKSHSLLIYRPLRCRSKGTAIGRLNRAPQLSSRSYQLLQPVNLTLDRRFYFASTSVGGFIAP